jgi:hypothetical protein
VVLVRKYGLRVTKLQRSKGHDWATLARPIWFLLVTLGAYNALSSDKREARTMARASGQESQARGIDSIVWPWHREWAAVGFATHSEARGTSLELGSPFASRRETGLAVFDKIATLYNPRRGDSPLGFLSPVVLEIPQKAKVNSTARIGVRLLEA